VKGVSTLYVFFGSDLERPIALRYQQDSEWLGTEVAWLHDYGSAWGIATRSARLMQPGDNADHDGIEDAHIEQSSVVHYFQRGRWITVDGSQP
jgi:hypothetical protein